MRIAIDARWVSSQLDGIGRYTLNLIFALASIDEENEYIIYLRSEHIADALYRRLGEQENFQLRIPHVPPLSLRDQVLFPIIICQDKPDLIHFPSFAYPYLLTGIQKLVTIHDLTPLAFPHLFRKTKKGRIAPLYRVMVTLATRRAQYIIAVSQSTKNDLCRLLNIAEDKVVVIYNGVEDRFHTRDARAITYVRKKYEFPAKFILHVGRYDPAKNVLTLIEAFDLLKKQSEMEDVKLVMVGAKTLQYPEIKAVVDNRGLNRDVIFTGYLDDEDLPSVYRAAMVLVLPSIYEGFGLPALEAMACGTPVITSNTSSLPEVVGEAGIMVEPRDVHALAEAMELVLMDKHLRSELRARGLERARQFTWEKAARETLKAYQQVANMRDRAEDTTTLFKQGAL